MLGNIGPMELLLIFGIVFVLVGAKRLPEMGASIGKGIREFKRSLSEVDHRIKEPDGARDEVAARAEPSRLLG